jgi:LDH2 family malate/lactate/ureidoglycolate dehydrogenase
MRLSAREVCQLADRCFAAADLSAGMATASAEAVWWTEAYKQSGVTTLHSLLDDLENCETDALTLREQRSMAAVVDCGEQPSLVAGTPVVDLCCSRANHNGSGFAYATLDEDDDTRGTLGYLAHKAAERGFVSIVLQTDGNADSGVTVGLPADSRPLVAEATLDAPAVSHQKIADIVRSGLHDAADSPLIQAFFERGGDDEYATAEACMFHRLLEQSTEEESNATVGPSFVLVCLDPRHPGQPDDLQRVLRRFVDRRSEAFTDVYAPAEMEEQVETLIHDGVVVDDEVWRDIFEYSSGILAPPFEGSRQDAGFGLND